MEQWLNKRFFRPDEVALILDLSRRTIYRMIRDGRLPGLKLGAGPWRIPREGLAGLLLAEGGGGSGPSAEAISTCSGPRFGTH